MAKARDLLGTRSQINGIFLQKGYTRLSGILSVPLKDSLRVSSSGSSILKFLGVKPLAHCFVACNRRHMSVLDVARASCNRDIPGFKGI